MITLDELERLLLHWALWARKRDDGGQGYPRRSPIAEAAIYRGAPPRTPTGPRPILSDPDAELVDSVMSAMRCHYREHYRAIRLTYLSNLPQTLVGQRLNCSRGKVSDYLREGKALMVGYLSARVA